MRVEIADCVFDINATYAYMKEFMKDYIVLDDTELKGNIPTIEVTDKEIEFEQEGYEETFDKGYLETLAVLRKLSEYLSLENVILFHGVAMTYNDRCYIISAKSGTGKSTHAALWKRYVTDGKVEIINGDKPFIRLNDKKFIVYGTPWCGKEGCHINTKAELAGIIFIERSKENYIERLDMGASLGLLMQQVHITNTGAALNMAVCDSLLNNVPIYRLGCDISKEAVRTSFEALTGKRII
ncbi:MAG: hypothetical protein IJY81_08375 [Lachnospiraceae bacterium]|nr:hypothetical protein [Lachnospiraceae bacterium]